MLDSKLNLVIEQNTFLVKEMKVLKQDMKSAFDELAKVTGEVLGEASADINNKIERENNLVVKTVQNIPQTQNER